MHKGAEIAQKVYKWYACLIDLDKVSGGYLDLFYKEGQGITTSSLKSPTVG